MPELYTDFVTSLPVRLIVGEDDAEETFYVHQRLLVERSEYFNTALRSNFPEAQTQTFRFKEDNPQAMWLFASSHYMNLEEIFEELYQMNSYKDSSSRFSMEDCLHRHAQAFVLGNKLMSGGFKISLLRNLCSFFKAQENQLVGMTSLVEAARVVYSGTSSEDGWEMRKLLAIYCATRLGPGIGPGDPHNQARSKHPWSMEDRSLLAASGLEEFIADVFGEAQSVKLPHISELQARFLSKQR